MSKTAVSAIAITASTPACTGSVIIKSACSVTLPGIFKEITITPFSFFIFLTASDISPPIKEPANTKTCALGSLDTASVASAIFSSPTIGSVSTLIRSPRILCLSASVIAPKAT